MPTLRWGETTSSACGIDDDELRISPFHRQEHVRGTIRLEFWFTRAEKCQHFTDHVSNVVRIDQGEA